MAGLWRPVASLPDRSRCIGSPGGRQEVALADGITLAGIGVQGERSPGPYGRCVYACDNDVVDQQVVALEFPGATTATFTMTAFSKPAGRATWLFGTRGELTGDGQAIRIYDFSSRAERLITPAPAGAMNAAEGHGGGDAGLMDAFTGAVATGNRELILSGPRESLASHLAVFAAERARLNGTVETIPPAGHASAS